MLGFSAIGQHAIAELIDYLPPLTYSPVSRLSSSAQSFFKLRADYVGPAPAILWDDDEVILWDDGTEIDWDN